jgi:hypothetical protein
MLYNIAMFEAFLHAGPPAAVEDRVIKEEQDSDEVFPGFEIIFKKNFFFC